MRISCPLFVFFPPNEIIFLIKANDVVNQSTWLKFQFLSWNFNSVGFVKILLLFSFLCGRGVGVGKTENPN